MSAAAEAVQTPAHPPEQPGLLGIDPPPAITDARLSLVGHVLRRPEVRISPDGKHGHLVVQVEQPPHAGHAGYPLVVVYSVAEADIPAIQLLAEQLLEPGALALCVFRGLAVDEARHQLRARHCDRVAHIPPAGAAAWLPGPEYRYPHREDLAA